MGLVFLDNSDVYGLFVLMLIDPDLPKLDFAHTRREMDIPGYVFPITTNLM